jgi:hypothetical protein
VRDKRVNIRDSGIEIVEARLARMAGRHSRKRLLESPPQTVFRIFIRTAAGAVDSRCPNAVALLTTLPGVLMMLQDPAEE